MSSTSDSPGEAGRPKTASDNDLRREVAVGHADENGSHDITSTFPPCIRPSRRRRKAQQQSRSALVQTAIHGSAQRLYARTAPWKADHSYISPRRFLAGGKRTRRIIALVSRTRSGASRERALDLRTAPLSLYTILARYLAHITEPRQEELGHVFMSNEITYLGTKGFAAKDVERWASSLLVRPSSHASERFLPGNTLPPLFVLLLFFRRKVITKRALINMMRHVDLRLQLEKISWKGLKILMIRLVRHIRGKWPEVMPWAAAIFTTEAGRIYDSIFSEGKIRYGMLSDMTHFCNGFMALLAQPLFENPVLSSLHQQSAQFQVLRFMASRRPALIVTKTGFRATVKTQLAHAKTAQEQEWATLKGPSWPPWKHDRTAMDEEKSYDFGKSRASRIMHQMFEAGYAGHNWEKIAEIYAGWDTDLSPTIQTRTLLPTLSTYTRAWINVDSLLWASRVRTTRTRREAWACFLICEQSSPFARPEVYHAMFEKLYYSEVDESRAQTRATSSQIPTGARKVLFPGDTKEVLPEPKSPINLIYISEPVPSFEQLYHRMIEKRVRPTDRFLAFLVDASTDFSTGMELLKAAKDDFDGQVQRLLDGSLSQCSAAEPIPGYFLAAFIRFLCRFGRFSHPPALRPILPLSQDHQRRFRHDRYYLTEYAYALLIHFRPQHRPAWTAYMEKLLFSGWDSPVYQGVEKRTAQYTMMDELCKVMQEEEIDVDDAQFRLVCTVVRSAAQAAFRGHLPKEDAHNIITAGPRQIRRVFQSLISTHGDQAFNPTESSHTLQPHIPGPTMLHAYVRALSALRDFEGLYSFSTWVASHRKEVTARAHAQHGGQRSWRRALVALRAGLDGVLEEGAEAAPGELMLLVKSQFEGIEEWGGWPSDLELELYIKNKYRSALK